jgi:undecaprenyl-diphosphatase
MKPWERLFFSLSSLVVLTTIGVKLHELDMPVARFVRSFDIHAVNRIGDFVAVAGKGEVIAGVLLLVWVIGWKLQREVLKSLSLRALFALLGAAACTQLLKHLIGRPRPRFAHADEIMLGPSLSSGLDAFPSGHTLDAFGVATVVAWYVPALRVPVFLAAVLVGLARIVRGSHFPTDVFAGAVLGVVIGSLAAVGFKRWREEALPGLLRTGVPMAVVLFLLVWVVLHPAPVWSLEINQLGAGVALLLAGAFLRGRVAPSREEQGSSRRTVGSVALILGVTVASGPWWGGLLLLPALVPASLARLQPDAPPFVNTLPVWGRESLAVGSALLAIAVIRSVTGLLPLA